MTVGVIPYFMVMFFAGIFFPLPPLEVMSFGENVIRLNAMNKILNSGAGIGDIGFEMTGVAFVSVIYLIIGLAAFRYRHMRLSS